MNEQHGLDYARLIYLLVSLKLKIPRAIQRALQSGSWLSQLSLGLGAVEGWLEGAEALYQRGKELGPGSQEEAVLLLFRLLESELPSSSLSAREKLAAYAALDRLLKSPDGLLGETVEVDLASGMQQVQTLQKWDSGFAPLDLATGGLYQGLIVLMGRPGSGKTSLLLTIAAETIRSGAAKSILFVENELPYRVFAPRVKTALGNLKPREKDVLLVGPISTSELYEYCRERPDDERVVFFDTPDVLPSTSGEDRRFSLEAAYQDLVRVKQISRAVFVPSQPRRKDNILTLESTAEAWAKAWYADILIGIQPQALKQLKLVVLKNRFGPAGMNAVFQYDYVSMTWRAAGKVATAEQREWGENDW